MTMSVTTTERRGQLAMSRLAKISFAFVSAADGTASGTTPERYTGEVWRVVFAPGTGGSQPTNNFDVVVNDEDGYDILAGQGTNISNTAPSTVVSSLGAVVNDTLTLSVTNAGNTKSGTVIVYIKA